MAALAQRIDLSAVAFAAAVAILAIGPAMWLAGTWLDPAFASHGVVYFTVVAALAAWSASSAIRTPGSADRLAVLLLAATALVRLAGQVLAIDTIGALALVIDVYAIGRLAGLDRRVRAVSPLWLAVGFAFALPLERILQRSIGFLLQEVSAQGACGMLSVLFDDVRCAGVRITVDGADVLVDLPCSGARSLIAFAFAFVMVAALVRPRPLLAALGALLAIAAALAGNFVRVTLLASGVALGPSRLGFDVMAQPWHDMAGVIAFVVTAPVIVLWARAVKPLEAPSAPTRARATRHRLARRGVAAALFVCAALAVVFAPRHPVDVARAEIAIAAPERVGNLRATPIELTSRERLYFEQYGGAAAKAAYGPFALMLARTSSPLRHLHAPDECLRGLGYRVEYLGLRFDPIPSARYRAVAPDGRVYRVDVSFLSDRGEAAASVPEAVWRWLNDRSSVWTAVQRIVPEDVDPRESSAFEAGVIAALDLTSSLPTMEAHNAR